MSCKGPRPIDTRTDLHIDDAHTQFNNMSARNKQYYTRGNILREAQRFNDREANRRDVRQQLIQGLVSVHWVVARAVEGQLIGQLCNECAIACWGSSPRVNSPTHARLRV